MRIKFKLLRYASLILTFRVSCFRVMRDAVQSVTRIKIRIETFIRTDHFSQVSLTRPKVSLHVLK
jgi:hypothetical protein